MKIKNIRGFTIIELMVVIAVISILLGIILPRFKGMEDVAKMTRAQSETRTLQIAIESWYINHTPHAYPAETTLICHDYLNNATPLIVATPLNDPFRPDEGGNEYNYYTSGGYYVVFSYGPNGVQDITGIGEDGYLQGVNDDDIYATNGFGFR